MARSGFTMVSDLRRGIIVDLKPPVVMGPDVLPPRTHRFPPGLALGVETAGDRKWTAAALSFFSQWSPVTALKDLWQGMAQVLDNRREYRDHIL
jgi:hypothetical protein